MAKKEGLGFDYDERTNVPTYEEVSSVMPKLKSLKKHHYGLIFGSIFVVAVLLATGFFAYQTVDPATISKPFKGMTGYIVNDVDYTDKEIYEIDIEGIPIDLTEEEETLIQSMNDTCVEEKRLVKASTKQEKENQCQTEIDDLKESHKSTIKALEDEIEELKSKLESCEEDLDECEG